MDAMQCLGGNGYINGGSQQEIESSLVAELSCPFLRLPHRTDFARLTTLHRRGWHTGDKADVDWQRVQPAAPREGVDFVYDNTFLFHGTNTSTGRPGNLVQAEGTMSVSKFHLATLTACKRLGKQGGQLHLCRRLVRRS